VAEGTHSQDNSQIPPLPRLALDPTASRIWQWHVSECVCVLLLGHCYYVFVYMAENAICSRPSTQVKTKKETKKQI